MRMSCGHGVNGLVVASLKISLVAVLVLVQWRIR